MLKQLKISIKQPYVEKCKTIESLVENQLIPGLKNIVNKSQLNVENAQNKQLQFLNRKKPPGLKNRTGKMLS